MLQENEHENALNWYEEELDRVEEAKLEAGANLEERKEESHSALISMKLSKSSADSHVAEICAKMASEEIKARQLEMEEERRMKEFAKQLEIKHKIEQAGNVAQKIELEAKGMRKTQEAKDEAARLAAEAENLEKVRNFVHYNDPESLPNRLRDFDDDSRELIPLSEFTQSVQTSHVTSLFSSSQPLSGSMHNVHATQVTSSPMSMKPRPSVSFMVPKSSSQSKTSKPVYQSWVECLPKTAQTDIASSPERKHVTYSCSSLPKLQLKKFDGDPLQWPDWSSMFKSIVHDADLSLNGKMQHLQNSVVGRAKSAIEGYGYSGDSYYEALKELEARFGKPSLVVKVTLDRLRKTSRMKNDRPHELMEVLDL